MGVQKADLKNEDLSNVDAILVKIWQEVFQIDDIGIYDEFYELGGNSLFSISIVSKINKEFNVDISLAEFLRIPKITIENASHYILSAQGNDNGNIIETLVPVLIYDTKEAEKRISEVYMCKNRFVKYMLEDKIYNVLFVEDAEIEKNTNILTFMKNNFAKEIIPHYIWPLPDLSSELSYESMDFKSLSNLLRLKRGDKKDFFQNLITNIKNSEELFYKDILGGNVIKKYASSPVQTSQVEQPFSVVGTIMHFDEYIYRELLEKSILRVISKNGLLRSVLCIEDGKMFWNEYEPPANIQLPFVDLSGWDFSFIEDGIIELLKEWYLKNFNKFDSLMYRVLLVKLNLREYILFFPIHFTIFDGTSSGILQKGIRSYYSAYEKGKEIEDSDSASYAEYVEQISKGPQQISEDEIIDQFNLNEYKVTLDHFNLSLKSKASSKTFIPYLCDIAFVEQEEDIKNEWELTYALFYLISSKFFDVKSIPTGIVGFGRRYQQNRYFDTMGELVDSIPYVVRFDGLNFKNSSNDMQEKFAIAQNHNINFMSFLHNEKIRKEWQKVISLVYPSRNDVEYPFIFNFQGRLENDIMAMRDIFEPLRYKSYMDQYKNKENKINDNSISLFFNAFFISNLLKINITTHYIQEKETLKRLFEEACEIINANYNIKLELKKIESYGVSSQ